MRYSPFVQNRTDMGNRMKKTTMAVTLMLSAMTATAQERVQTAFVSGTTTVAKEGADKAADGRKYTKWCIDAREKMPYTIVLDARQAVAVGEYGLVTGDDSSTYTGRNPHAWQLLGSNDNKAWDMVHEVKWDRAMRDENEQEYRYKTGCTKAYRYYMFKFISMTEGTRLQLSEINLYR